MEAVLTPELVSAQESEAPSLALGRQGGRAWVSKPVLKNRAAFKSHH
jgi:hypothetical protein